MIPPFGFRIEKIERGLKNGPGSTVPYGDSRGHLPRGLLKNVRLDLNDTFREGEIAGLQSLDIEQLQARWQTTDLRIARFPLANLPDCVEWRRGERITAKMVTPVIRSIPFPSK
jgi:hypothetical protein